MTCMQTCIGVREKTCTQIFNSSSPVLTEFINIKASIKEIILQLLLIMVFFIVIKVYLAARNCENKKKYDAVSNSDQKSKDCSSQHIRFNFDFWLFGYFWLYS